MKGPNGALGNGRIGTEKTHESTDNATTVTIFMKYDLRWIGDIIDSLRLPASKSQVVFLSFSAQLVMEGTVRVFL